MILTIIGSLFKIMHWPGASIMLIIGMLSEAAALIILIITILK
ncbi:GldL-related protein [Flavobacterium sp.]